MIASLAHAPAAPHGEAPSRTRPPIIEALREGTRAAHDRIEQNRVMGRLTQPDLDLTDYTLVLKRMLGLHLALEGPLAAALAHRRIPLGLDQRRKTPLLRRDLMALGALEPIAPASIDLAALLADEPSAWGTLYVLEGSTLGGRIILRNVERALGLTGENGASFFAGYGERTGERWKVFVEELAATHDRHPAWQAPIVAAASACFDAMDTWLEESPLVQ